MKLLLLSGCCLLLTAYYISAAPQGIEWYQPPNALGRAEYVSTPPCYGCYSLVNDSSCKYDFLKCIPVVVLPDYGHPNDHL